MTTKEENAVTGENVLDPEPHSNIKKSKIRRGWILFGAFGLGLIWIFSLPTNCGLSMRAYVAEGLSYANQLTEPLTEYYRGHG